MLTIFAVLFALCVVAAFYGILAWAAIQNDDALDEIEQRKLNAIAERSRQSKLLRNGNRREG